MPRVAPVLLLFALAALAPATLAAAPGFTYFDAAWFHASPDQGASGNGYGLDASYAISPNAFLQIGTVRRNVPAFDNREIRFSWGINTTATAGYSFYSAMDFNYVKNEPAGFPARSDHDFGLTVGLLAQPADDWLFSASGRYTHNDVAIAATTGTFATYYAITRHFQLGLQVTAGGQESDVGLSARLDF